MHKSLEFFTDLTYSPLAKDLPIIVLLNMVDIFDWYFKFLAISDNFPDYPKYCDSKGACQFFKAKFARLDKRPVEGRLQVHITSAVDPVLFKETSREFRDIMTRTK